MDLHKEQFEAKEWNTINYITIIFKLKTRKRVIENKPE